MLKEQQEKEKMLNWVDNELERVETTQKVTLTEAQRNAVLKTAEDYQPLDKEGNLDLVKAYEIYDLKQKAKQSEKQKDTVVRKQIAAETTDTSVKAEPPTRNIPGPHSFANGLTAALQSLNK